MVVCLLTVPVLLIVGTVVWLLTGDMAQLILFPSGMIALPDFAPGPGLGKGARHCALTDAAKAAGRSLKMILALIVSSGRIGGSGRRVWHYACCR